MAGGIISADFLFNLEKKMRILNERNYFKLIASDKYWADKLLKLSNIEGKSDRVFWLLETASIEQLSPNDGGENGGALNFDELATLTTEFLPAYHGRGYRIGKLKYKNFLSAGVDPAARWAAAIGTYGAYYPQRLLAILILNGANINSYDGVSFFNTLHPVHPLIPSLGTFANDFTGAPVAASGLTPAYPGALPIDDTQSIDVALIHLTKALAYISGAIGQPNGAGDPRMLEPKYLFYPPRMEAQVAMLTDSDYIAKVAGSAGTAGGSADVRSLMKKFRMLEPIKVPEFDGSRSYTFMNPATGQPVTVTGSDTTYYIGTEDALESEMGAFLHTMREPFSLQTYTGEGGGAVDGVDAILGRSNDLEWHYHGWQSVNPGHPYGLFRFRGT